jgi:aminoglycoside 6'-N-acetyltransferase I
VTIRRAIAGDAAALLRLRHDLWPDEPEREACIDLAAALADPMRPVFVAVRPDGSLGGFVEGGERACAEGYASSPVGYVEGWFVDPDLRLQGVGAALHHALEDWARDRGYTEIASDTWLDNTGSASAHLALGYAEVERLVHFRKEL